MTVAEPIILFTGFEPSGDDHAAAVIREVLRRRPGLRVFAWGGPRMRAAGATIVEETGRDAVMGVPGLGKILEHRRINASIARWMDEHRAGLALHVPVDSPAANFSICAMAKRRGVRVMHLVAPQIWAWGRWRIHKLRRLTDFVCCLLPFEERFFGERGVPARFVGHPLFDEPVDVAALDAGIAAWPGGSPRLALMPGSRPAEIEKNFPVLLNAYRHLAREYGGIAGVVAATTEEVASRLRVLGRSVPAPAGLAEGWPESLRIEVRRTDEVVRWCEVALVVSGTVTLQVARQQRPMVIVYKSSRLMYELVGRWLVATPHFSLPNLVAGERVTPEFIPHFGGHEPIVRAAVELIERPEAAAAQVAALGRVAAAFEGSRAAANAADAVLRLLMPERGASEVGAEAAAAAG